ncbi:MAG: THUMP domain-containing protein, partial [Candidatus Bathyarchaeia archaeon]
MTEFDSVIVRLGGEIGIKSERTRVTYERLLLKNIKNALEHYRISYEKILRERGRIYIKTKNPQETAAKLTQVFGVSSVSPAIQTVSYMENILETAVKLAVATMKSESSFAVRCRRVGKHPYSSMDVCKEVGKQVSKSLEDRNLRVNLKNPQFTINIEVRDANAYIFSENLKGTGGFPLGSQSKVVCLLSGGIDSAVA